MLKTQLEKETRSRQAMELCFKKIHKSLDLYKGHFINRLRFHMNRHHTEYLRKVRVLEGKYQKASPKQAPARRSERVSQLEETTAHLEMAKSDLAKKEARIEELCRLLELAEEHPDRRVDTSIPAALHGRGTQTDLSCDDWDSVLVGP